MKRITLTASRARINLYLLALLALAGQIHGFIVTGSLLSRLEWGWVAAACIFFIFVVFIINAVVVVGSALNPEEGNDDDVGPKDTTLTT